MGFVSAGRNQGTKFYFELPLYNASSAGPISDAASNLRSNPFLNSFQPASQRYTPAAANTSSPHQLTIFSATATATATATESSKHDCTSSFMRKSRDRYFRHDIYNETGSEMITRVLTSERENSPDEVVSFDPSNEVDLVNNRHANQHNDKVIEEPQLRPRPRPLSTRLFENDLVLEDCRVDAPVTLKPTYQRQATNPSGGR